MQPGDVILAPLGHFAERSEAGRGVAAGQLHAPGENLAVSVGGSLPLLQLLIDQADLIQRRRLPGWRGIQRRQVLIDLQGIQVIGLLVKLVGDFVAGAALPVHPQFRVALHVVLLRLQEQEHLSQGVRIAAHRLVGAGQDEADLRHVRIIGEVFQEGLRVGNGVLLIGQIGEGADQFELDLLFVERRAVGFEQARVEIGRLVE